MPRDEFRSSTPWRLQISPTVARWILNRSAISLTGTPSRYKDTTSVWRFAGRRTWVLREAGVPDGPPALAWAQLGLVCRPEGQQGLPLSRLRSTEVRFTLNLWRSDTHTAAVGRFCTQPGKSRSLCALLRYFRITLMA